MDLKKYIRSIPDYPKKGILFRDITTLVKDKDAFKDCINQMSKAIIKLDFDKIAAIEARGFLLGAPLAYLLNIGLVLIRKPGKLPSETIDQAIIIGYADCGGPASTATELNGPDRINIYPNPCATEINIDMTNRETDTYHIEIYSVFGQKLKSIKTTEHKTSIDIRELEVGVYSLIITARDSKRWVRNFIKSIPFH